MNKSKGLLSVAVAGLIAAGGIAKTMPVQADDEVQQSEGKEHSCKGKKDKGKHSGKHAKGKKEESCSGKEGKKEMACSGKDGCSSK